MRVKISDEPMRIFLPTLILAIAVGHLSIAGKKNKDEATQVLALPKEPPAVAVGETSRLLFHVSPLSAKGLLSAQTRDAVKALMKANGGAQFIHLRAFVAGSGDMRRVPQIVSEVLSEKKMALPSVSVIQGGALELVNAQVVLEAVSAGKKDVNPEGLRFESGTVFSAADPAANTGPLLQKSADALAQSFGGSSALAVTCFVSLIEPDSTALVSRKFPNAAVNVLQTQRAPVQALANCGGVARGGPVTAQKLAFSGTQMAFGYDEKDATLAFQRFDQQLSQAGANPARTVFANLYPVSRKIAELARRLRPALRELPSVPVEGLASMDGSFAVDAVAPVINQ